MIRLDSIVLHICMLQGKKTSAVPPVQDEYSVILDKWIYKSTCPTGQVEFAERKKMFFSTEV